MKYIDIPGWYDFDNFYDEIIRDCPDGCSIVEVGCWFGKSTIDLAKKVIKSNKSVTIFAVDTWKGDAYSADQSSVISSNHPGYVWNCFVQNVKDNGVGSIIVPMCMPSVEASKMFQDKSVFMVFIDAGHDYESVKQDVQAWKPKIQEGGILAGHDYSAAEVKSAVDASVAALPVSPSSWKHRVTRLHPVSGYMMTMNEERCVASSLTCLSNYVDHITLLDAGSNDSTLDIVRGLNLRVPVDIIVFPQKDSRYEAGFRESLRRNMCLSACPYDWVLTIDADELLDDVPGDYFRASCENMTFDRYNLLNETENILAYKVDGVDIPWYPDRQVRFFNKTDVSYSKDSLHCFAKIKDGTPISACASTVVSEVKIWHFHSFVREFRHSLSKDPNRYSYLKTEAVTRPLPAHFSLINCLP
jgi:hypothetical protein